MLNGAPNRRGCPSVETLVYQVTQLNKYIVAVSGRVAMNHIAKIFTEAHG